MHRFNEVQYDTSVDDGAVLYKLILRAFPNHFKGNSVYAHFPFVIPEENLVILKELGRADKYSWAKPKRIPDLIVVKSYAAAKKVPCAANIFRRFGGNWETKSLGRNRSRLATLSAATNREQRS